VYSGDEPIGVVGNAEACIAAIPKLLEALHKAEVLAGIASDWDLGTDGKVEIDGEWVGCYELQKEFRAVIADVLGDEWRFVL